VFCYNILPVMSRLRSFPDYAARIEDLKRYIGDHISEPLYRDVLASVTGFSIPHLHRIFVSHTGQSVAAYVRWTRLERAGRKLRMGAVDITEVTLAAGYDSHAAFGKAFKQQFGLSPSEFRRLSCYAATQILKKGTPHED
jgi:AraC family transcriptional regulator